MGRYSKPGVAWAEIEIRWRQGENEAALAREFGVSKQAVNQRKKREGWERGNPVMEQESQPVVDDHWLALANETDTAKRLIAPSSRSDHQLLAWGKRTAENLAAILRHIERGIPEGLAAKAVGLDPETLRTWRREINRGDRSGNLIDKFLMRGIL